jgi:hypothetical protein
VITRDYFRSKVPISISTKPDAKTTLYLRLTIPSEQRVEICSQRAMSSLMLSIETNDGIVLKYSDTCSGDRYKWNKDPLILVRSAIFHQHTLIIHIV